jgi:hypothetical protein
LDKKTNDRLFKIPRTLKSQLITVPPQSRIDIRWGDVSLVEAEFIILELACCTSTYAYIHLLSGQDLPLKNQDDIHSFFDSLPLGTNLVGFSQGEYNQFDLLQNTQYYHILTRHFHCPNKRWQLLIDHYRNLFLNFQKIVGYKRKWPYKLYKGSNWISITQDFCCYLIAHKGDIIKSFRGVRCSDEIFVQSLIANSPYKDTVADYSKDSANLTRKIDWERGNPYIWRKWDYKELIESDALFARKFNSGVDKDIINLISDRICN